MRGEEGYNGTRALRVVAAGAAGLVGVIAASAAVGDYAVARSDMGSGWRDLQGTLGWISILAALCAVGLGLTSAVMGERRRAAVGVAVIGTALGLLTMGYWVWVIEGILDTT